MFFLLITMALILMRNLVELYNNVKRYSKRLELMSEEKTKITSELHDGIGGIMTNINFLVEIAKDLKCSVTAAVIHKNQLEMDIWQ